MYDITSDISFENVQEWLHEIENNADRDVLVYLVGNRADLEEEREVSAEAGLALMKELKLHNHLETSALTGKNIGNLFETMTKHLFLEHNGKLSEFGGDKLGDGNDNSRSASIAFKLDKKNNDLYGSKVGAKKKRKCC